MREIFVIKTNRYCDTLKTINIEMNREGQGESEVKAVTEGGRVAITKNEPNTGKSGK